MVRWPAVFQTGLLVVVGFAQRLPVAPGPEQLLVSTVWDDVVNNRCSHVSSLCHALNTQWVRHEKLLAGLLPGAAISATGRASRFLRMEDAVILTVLTLGHQLRAAGMCAWALRSDRHHCHLVAEAWFQTPAGILRCKTRLRSPYR